MKLALGVMDMAYSDASTKGASTTGQVAEILEARYHIMETFYEVNQDFVGDQIAQSIADAIGNPRVNATFAGEQAIEKKFRAFLDADEMSKLVAGLSPELRGAMGPSANFSGAATAGVSHRKKKPYAKSNPARPAFVDTGLYQTSFRAWMEK